MAPKLEGAGWEVFDRSLPSLAERGEIVTIPRKKGHAAAGHVELAESDPLQRAAVRLHAETPHQRSLGRAADGLAIERPRPGPDARTRRAGAANSLRRERAHKGPHGPGIDVHVTVRIGVRGNDAAVFHPANLSAELGL